MSERSVSAAGLALLVFQPRTFFAQPAEAIGWVWPALGFYLFGFASYFQSFLVPGYHVPYWLVLYIVAWVPALMLAAAGFVVLVLLWYWPAARLLAGGQPLGRCTRIVGAALLPPAVALLAALLLLAVLDGNGIVPADRAVVRTVHAAAAGWALVLATLGAAVSHRLGARRTALFLLWFLVLAAALLALASALAPAPG